MKSLLRILFIHLLLLSVVGCKNIEEEGAVGNVPEDLGLEAYIQTVELPENLLIDFDASEVESMDMASVHTAEILKLDEQERDLVIDKLVRGEVNDTKIYAEGPWLEADYNGVKEYLTIFDGGESFGIDFGVNGGGFSYGMYIDGESFFNKLSTVIESFPGPPGSIAQEFGYDLQSDYGSYVNLDFMNYTDALSAVKDILNSIGLPEVSVSDTYSIDLDTILEHYDLYLDSRGYFGIEEDEENYVWSKDDESYLFFLRQIIDDIPLVGLPWPKIEGIPGEKTESSNAIGYTSIDVIYSKDGIVNLSATNLLDVGEGGKKKSLINGATALKSVIDSYSEILLVKETYVTSMELCYVAILTDEDSYELVPAWIFEIAEENKQINPIEGMKPTYLDYSYFVVNAVTGDRIEKVSDME